jgi:hypothetical protein
MVALTCKSEKQSEMDPNLGSDFACRRRPGFRLRNVGYGQIDERVLELFNGHGSHNLQELDANKTSNHSSRGHKGWNDSASLELDLRSVSKKAKSLNANLKPVVFFKTVIASTKVGHGVKKVDVEV